MKSILKADTFRAFRNRNYALFFSGQSVSQIGTWMQRTGVSWVVYTMTRSAFMLGVTVFAMQFPSFIFSLYGGIIADRYDRYKILLITQTASMIQAALLAALVLTGHSTVWWLLSLSIILGIINAFDVPARQPMVHEMINNKDDLPNAMALNAAMVNVARLIGPALSGIILQRFGGGICFLLNGVSFIAVIISLLLMKMPAHTPPQTKKKITSDLVEGFAYLKNTPSIGVILLMLTLASLLVLPYNTLLPVFAKVVYRGDAATFGYINSFIGLGAIIGTIGLASLKSGTNLKKILFANTTIMGVSLVLFAFTHYFWLAMFFATICGLGTMAQTTICITIIQVDGDKNMRGRVMSFVAMAYFGMLPLGSLIIGAISQQIGAPYTLAGEGILGVIIALAFAKFLRKDKLNKNDPSPLEQAEELAIEKI